VQADGVETCTRSQTAADAQTTTRLRAAANSTSGRGGGHLPPPAGRGRSSSPGRRLAGDGRAAEWSAPTIRRQPEYRAVDPQRSQPSASSSPSAAAAATSAHLPVTSSVTCSLLAAALLLSNANLTR